MRIFFAIHRWDRADVQYECQHVASNACPLANHHLPSLLIHGAILRARPRKLFEHESNHRAAEFRVSHQSVADKLVGIGLLVFFSCMSQRPLRVAVKCLCQALRD